MPITYKCPNCGAAMEFDSTAQKLKCPSCQMEMDVQDYEKQYGHLYSDAEAGENAQSAQSEGQKGKGSMNMKVYHCQSCGAELLADIPVAGIAHTYAHHFSGVSSVQFSLSFPLSFKAFLNQ